MSRDDVVLQRPEDLTHLVSVFHTPSACPGAVTSYLLRRIAYRAGAYAPGLQEELFHELHVSRDGSSLERVKAWFGGRVSSLAELGYRLQVRQVTIPTPAVVEWVRGGRGYRGAMIPTNFKKLHPQPGAAGDGADVASHAIGVTVDRIEAGGKEDVVMIDPWPGVVGGAKDRAALPANLESAHRDRNFHALVFFWVGWS